MILSATKEHRMQALGTTKVIRGRGDYEMGKNAGAKVGSWVGGKLQQWFSSLFGSGDYNIQAQSVGDIKSNSLIAGSSVPSFSTNGGGGDVTRIAFHEFVTNIKMTAAFNCQTFDIDITAPRTFPWVSRLARNYQQWRLVGCVFFLRSLSSDTAVAPTQGMGSVAGAVRYDVHSDPPTSKAEILNSMFASSAKPSQNQALPLECAPKMTIISPLKVLPIGAIRSDLQFYQMAKLDICTEGAANDYEDALELHVAYEVEFLKPCTQDSVANMYFMDLLSTDQTRPLQPIPNTALVRQPRINTLGGILSPDHTTLQLPLTLEPDSCFLVIFAIARVNAGYPNISPCTVNGAGGMRLQHALCDQAVTTLLAPEGASTGNAQSVSCQIYIYDGSGTSLSPPILIAALDPTKYVGEIGGNFIVVQIDKTAASGLTAHQVPSYTRAMFTRYLCDVVGGRASKCPPPPGLGRVADWTHQFSKTNEWPRSKPLPKSSTPFDQTYVEALTYMMQYCVPDVDEKQPETVVVHPIPPVQQFTGNCTCPTSTCTLHDTDALPLPITVPALRRS